MEEKTLGQLVEEETENLKTHIGERKISVYGLMEYMIKELFFLKNMLNEKRLFTTSKEEIARIMIRVYLLSNVALDKLGYKE